MPKKGMNQENTKLLSLIQLKYYFRKKKLFLEDIFSRLHLFSVEATRHGSPFLVLDPEESANKSMRKLGKVFKKVKCERPCLPHALDTKIYCN